MPQRITENLPACTNQAGMPTCRAFRQGHKSYKLSEKNDYKSNLGYYSTVVVSVKF